MAKLTRSEVKSSFSNIGYRAVASFALGFIMIGGVFYHFVERFSWLDSFYFTFITLATVGYGDFTPKTAAGKIFTMFYVLFGVTIFIVLAKIVLASAAVHREHRTKK